MRLRVIRASRGRRRPPRQSPLARARASTRSRRRGPRTTARAPQASRLQGGATASARRVRRTPTARARATWHRGVLCFHPRWLAVTRTQTASATLDT